MTAFTGHAHVAIWVIAALSTVGILVRPFKLPEAVWAVGGAALVVDLGLLPSGQALAAVGKGGDVYLFLIGMMLLSETAREQGLFDWVAAIAVKRSRGSPQRLFLLIYGVGVVVTTFLSNDAAAVVLTPAVCAATKKAEVTPLPFLFVCAFIANAASFVLPISNPANIVLYGDHTPRLGAWLASFALPSIAAIVVTYGVMRLTVARRLEDRCFAGAEVPDVSIGMKVAMGGLGMTAVALLVSSSLDIQLGLPTAVMGIVTTGMVLVAARAAPWATVRGVSWAVLPLVAGLFVLVEAVSSTGVVAALARGLQQAMQSSPTGTAWGAGAALAFVANAMNNLPAGLIASSTIQFAHPPQTIVDALLIGVDLGPNLSITGSLATILWLTAIRREGTEVGFWRFLGVGVLVMPPALAAALLTRLW